MTQSHSENPLVIAIDGASGSGKSSTARGVAKRLGLAYLDTGAMYQTVTIAYLDSGVDGSDLIAPNNSLSSRSPRQSWRSSLPRRNAMRCVSDRT